MSIVVAVRKDNRLVFAADTLCCFGDSERIPPGNSTVDKIIRLGSSIVGATGWAVYDDILRDYFGDTQPPPWESERAIFSFFMDLWKALHDKYPFVNDQANDKNTPFGDLDTTFIIGNEHGLFKVSSDMGVTRFQQYCAIGSGSAYAMGVIHTLYDTDLDAEAIARRATEAAITFDVYCGGHVAVLEVE